MKKLIFTIAMSLGALISNAQVTPIMVCNAAGSTCTPYYNLDTAYTYAASGDYIYIPGGVYTIASTVAKEVHIYGAGSKADSTIATGSTTINGNITMNGGASNSSIEGIYFSGSIVTGTMNNLKVSYCNFHSMTGTITNSTIRGSIFRTSGLLDNNFNHGIGNLISNCYIYRLANYHSSVLDQCVDLQNCVNFNFVTIKNSILRRMPTDDQYGQVGSNNIFKNNVFVSLCTSSCLNAISSINNVQETLANIFETNGFNTDNMHVDAGSVAMTASETGGEVGVFGGSFPFKDGLVPSNPHIFLKNISSITDNAGNLPVQIKVRAENY